MNINHTLDAHVELVELRSLTPPQLSPKSLEAASPKSRTRFAFILLVVLPTLLAIAYYGFIATSQFASETRFTIRSPQRNVAGLLSGFLQSTGFVRTQDDTYSVREFIRSRTAAEMLANDDHLREILARPEADFWARFPSPWSQSTHEALFRAYLKFINVTTDNNSGITTLEVRAFRPEDARDIALALLHHSEGLINRLNDRARQDAIQHAENEVRNCEKRLTDVQTKITSFRNRESMIDPVSQSTAVLELIARLSSNAAEKRAQLSEVERQTSQSPMIPALRAHIAAIEDQINAERAKVVGNDSSIAPRIAQFEQLVLERELMTRMLTSASTSLENAKVDAQRQQLYLERIVEPNLPDHALYPRSLYMVLITAAVGLALYGIFHIVLVHIREQAKY